MCAIIIQLLFNIESVSDNQFRVIITLVKTIQKGRFMARLKILSGDDFNHLYAIPKLEEEDHPYVFELDDKDHEYLAPLDMPQKIDYVLQLTYFCLSQYFFSFTFHGCRKDTWYVIDTFFPGEKFPRKQISKNKRYKNRSAILEKYDMSLYTSKLQEKLEIHAKNLAKQHTIPKYLFDSLLDYCHQKKTIRPGYSVLQKIISGALEGEKKRLSNKLYSVTDKTFRAKLTSLLERDDDYYQLTSIKNDQKDFTTTEITNTLEKHQLLVEIYERSIEITKELGVSEQNVMHYADLAVYHTIYGLKTMKKKNLARLYLICYAHYRFRHVVDHLVFSFSHKVNFYLGEAEEYQGKAHVKIILEDDSDRSRAANILSLLISKKVKDSEIRSKAYEITPQEKLPSLIQRIKKPKFNAELHRWEYYSKSAQAIKRNLRGIFTALDFQTQSDALTTAITFLKSHIEGNNTSFKSYPFRDVPIAFIPKALRRYVIEKVKEKASNKKIKRVNGDRYEFMLYWQLEKQINSGGVTLKNSLSYKALHDELINSTEWLKNKVTLIRGLGNKLLQTNAQEILNTLKERLKDKYMEVNQHINNGDNKKIKLKYNKQGDVVKWRLPYKKSDDGVNNPFYENLPTVSIGSVINFAIKHSSFMKRFRHILPANSKKEPNKAAVSACVVAQGTGSDINRMKEISDIKEQELKSTSKNFIRHKTLLEASNDVMNKTEKLSIFEKYTLADYGVHASVDGQKLEAKCNTIKARYSSKYFGFGKGISAYTLFANCLPLCSKIIGANEHESHYLFDILNSNTSDIKVAAVSGDMHSINRVNFALLYFFGYRFMPRFTQLDKKASRNLVCFGDLKKYETQVIKPSKIVDTKLIIKEWDNILRILVTLGLKKNTQSHIVRKLSSYKTNDTLKALIEFDKIIMSLYILDYVDDEQVRKTVQRSLNRGESYHQLRSAIAKVSGRKLTGKNEKDLIVNNECARLIANCIIFYNASILSGIYDHYKKGSMDKECAKIIRFSPVAWQHINLIGMYEFGRDDKVINLQQVIDSLVNHPKIDLCSAA